MSLLDFITGGQTSNAQDDLTKALQAIQGVNVPSVEALDLPQLQQYVQAGIMTPAQAAAVLQWSNAYNSISTSPSNLEAENTALSQLQQVAGDSGMTPEMRAQLTAAIDAANTNTQGERGSIQDAMAQRGISNSLMGAAAQQAAAGQDAQTANLAATQAAGQAEQNALAAMSGAGSLAGNIENQQFGEQAQKAAAQNAINQWNAQNQTQTNQYNASNAQAANAYNAENAQNVSNQNTGLANQRTQYNAQVPQTVFNDQMQKATGQAGVNQAQANQATQAGQQQAGLISGILGGASQMGASYLAPTPIYAADGGMIMKDGGEVPGRARVAGDSPANDTVPARLSPGEIVVPRSLAHNPDMAKNFIQHLIRQRPVKPAHPHDVRSVLDALASRRAA